MSSSAAAADGAFQANKRDTFGPTVQAHWLRDIHCRCSSSNRPSSPLSPSVWKHSERGMRGNALPSELRYESRTQREECEPGRRSADVGRAGVRKGVDGTIECSSRGRPGDRHLT